ncbi:3-deoxy-D-manno-octulosonic acid transferase [Xenorhabdus khoisanae]|uniref:3-deoxy-D-manno-octulosonic acid transferase n=1 Tax=Xenorhabdus khoisanae TaxID=880157 RepID=A0A0J5FXR9_9GAMM|nr:3-deoxy-D-manno-octulosonic acid transferase [Xenorhabdus khoisanae]
MDEQRDFSDFVVYVDESGDHGLVQLDKNYPVFVLAFCIFYKEHYLSKVVPKLQKLKFDYFGHDLVILHEHEIRKEKGDFTIFKNREEKNQFLDRLNSIISESNFILSSCVIEKHKLNVNKDEIQNPYHIALRHCLETLYDFVVEKGQQERETHVIMEKRGIKEDRELELEFRRICDGENKYHRDLPFKIRMAAKTSNSSGLQLADLVARPIGRHVLKPEQFNRAFDILKEKFYCEGGRNAVGMGYKQWGLKIFPQP